MPIITYWNPTRDQTGQTMSAIATATKLAIDQNVKVLLISPSLNDNTMKDSFWNEKKGILSGIFGAKANLINQSGIEGLDRIVRSNKISPEIIKDYTRVKLKNRLEILLGVTGTEEQYNAISKQYLEIIVLASQYYDFVFVDLDKRLSHVLQKEILKRSDLIIPIISQKESVFQEYEKYFAQIPEINRNKIIYTIGRYNDKTKYNSKNISRNILRTKDEINTIPFNNLLFESSQEGNVVDLLINLSGLKGKDENTEFMEQISRLIKDMRYRISINQSQK